jgi:FkbM family methyltransferase
MSASRAAQKVMHAFGLHVSRYARRLDLVGIDAMSDIALLLDGVTRPVVFDVGAYTGDTVELFRRVLPDCEIHAFEPSPSTFLKLEEAAGDLERVHLVNAGVGSTPGTSVLIENEHRNMSSLLRPSKTVWGRVLVETPVDVITLDAYAARSGVERVDVLKTDTQGYDFEVLRGASGLIESGRVRLVHTEIIFSEMYEGIPPFDELYRFLRERGFRLVGFYNTAWQGQRASWCDALFAID